MDTIKNKHVKSIAIRVIIMANNVSEWNMTMYAKNANMLEERG